MSSSDLQRFYDVTSTLLSYAPHGIVENGATQEYHDAMLELCNLRDELRRSGAVVHDESAWGKYDKSRPGAAMSETPSPFQTYAERAEKIQASCACIRWEARECYQARHHRPYTDLDDERWQDDDDDCCCRCHDELREREEDVYGPRED